MKTERYRYIEWTRTKTSEVLARELYDHKYDPDENINVSPKPEYQDKILQLSAMLKAGWQAARPPGM